MVMTLEDVSPGAGAHVMILVWSPPWNESAGTGSSSRGHFIIKALHLSCNKRT